MKKIFKKIWKSAGVYALRSRIQVSYDVVTGYSLQKKIFLKRTGYALDLKNPQSFNQKVCWRKIYDHNILFPVCADKYRVRDYVRLKMGDDALLIPMLAVADRPEDIPFDQFHTDYIVKANHGSGTNIIVKKSDAFDKKHIIQRCHEWLNEPFGLQKHEWAYESIPRKIIVEQLLEGENGLPPMDYKFHMFHGKCGMIQINQGNFADKNTRTLTLLDQEWNKFDVFWEFPPADHVSKPDNLADMLNVAERLSTDFDYVRIDLYNVKGKIYFGEFTFYPTSGQSLVKPREFDFQIGKLWNLPHKA